MGCDIHMYAEVRREKEWAKVGSVFKSTWSDEEKTDHPYNGRNYELFAFLAGVRNRFDVEPIAEPRGYPEGISVEVKKELDDWDSDGHSASWFSLKELQDANWEYKFQHGGVVPSAVYEYCKEIQEPPKVYSQGIGGGNIQTVSEKEWDQMDWDTQNNGTRWYVHMFWETSIRDECKQFVEETMGFLAQLGAPEDVRVIFNFDN